VLLDQYGNPIGTNNNTQPIPPAQSGSKGKPKFQFDKKGMAKAGGTAADITAVLAVPAMTGELQDISKDTSMSDKEKSIASGGAIGETVGTVSGAAAGALAGAATGSVVPFTGTVLGALTGGVIGQFGGLAGRMIGEKTGEAIPDGETQYTTQMIHGHPVRVPVSPAFTEPRKIPSPRPRCRVN